RGVRQYHSAQVDIALHCIARIDLHTTATPDDRHASALRENGEIFAEVHVCEQFHNHVNAAAAGRLHDLFEMVGRAMIEHFVRALFARELESSSLPAVPNTRRPRARASCTAAVPTPPLAPCISTVSPGCASARWNSPRYAVAYGVPMAAPCG